jgi:hypothetical protein
MAEECLKMNKRNLLLGGGLTAAILLVVSNYVLSGLTYYVSPNGNDGNPCTLAQPCASIERVQGLAEPGDTIHIQSGSYSAHDLRVNDLHGQPDSPYVITGGTIEGDEEGTFAVTYSEYVVFRGLKINYITRGLYFQDGAENILIEGNEFYQEFPAGSTWDSLKDTRWEGGGVYFSSGSLGWDVVRNNQFHDMFNAVYVTDDRGGPGDYNNHIFIHGNEFENVIDDPVELEGDGSDIHVYENTFIETHRAVSIGTNDQVYIYDNQQTVAGNPSGDNGRKNSFLKADGMDGNLAVVFNNTVRGLGAPEFYFIDFNDDPCRLEIYYNDVQVDKLYDEEPSLDCGSLITDQVYPGIGRPNYPAWVDGVDSPSTPVIATDTPSLSTDVPPAMPIGNLYYVSRGGSNRDGLSWESAWNELDQIEWSQVDTPATILLDGDTYFTPLDLPVGVDDLTITKGRGGEVVIDGEFKNSRGIKITCRGSSNAVCENITISNLTVRRFSSYGIYGTGEQSGGMHNITIDNVRVLDFHRAGIFLEGNGNDAGNFGLVVKNSYLDDDDNYTGQADGIYVQHLKDFTADNNYIILDNNYTGREDVHSDNIQAFWVDDITYSNNIVVQKSDKTLGTQMLFTEAGRGEHRVVNNVFYRDAPQALDWAIRLKQSSGGDYLGIVYGNTFIGYGKIMGGDGRLVAKNNLFYRLDNANYYHAGSGSDVSDNLFTSSNPGFVNANYNSFDLHLLPGSEAIDAGVILGEPYNVDKDGFLRPQGNGWDIGAYEYGGQAPPPTPTATVPAPDTSTPTPPILTPTSTSTTMPPPTATPTNTGTMTPAPPTATPSITPTSESPTPFCEWNLEYETDSFSIFRVICLQE